MTRGWIPQIAVSSTNTDTVSLLWETDAWSLNSCPQSQSLLLDSFHIIPKFSFDRKQKCLKNASSPSPHQAIWPAELSPPPPPPQHRDLAWTSFPRRGIFNLLSPLPGDWGTLLGLEMDLQISSWRGALEIQTSSFCWIPSIPWVFHEQCVPHKLDSFGELCLFCISQTALAKRQDLKQLVQHRQGDNWADPEAQH